MRLEWEGSEVKMQQIPASAKTVIPNASLLAAVAGMTILRGV